MTHHRMTDAEIAEARANLERRHAARRAKLADRLEAARADARRIAEHIVRVYRRRRLYQWGSLVQGTHFNEHSDIDFAVDGVDDPAAFFAMLKDCEEMTSFPVDIVDLKTVMRPYRRSIVERGRLVYQAPTDDQAPAGNQASAGVQAPADAQASGIDRSARVGPESEEQ